MKKYPLNQTIVSNAKSHKKTYIVRDKKLQGFHLIVYPSGRKTFALTLSRNNAKHSERIGDAAKMTLGEARALTQRRTGSLAITGSKIAAANLDIETKLSTVADVMISRHERRWKKSTMEVNLYYLKNQILPFFGEVPIANITRCDIETWFGTLSHIPESANRSVPVLSAIMREAEELGMRPEESNPCAGLHRYKRRMRERVLTSGEMVALGKALIKAAKKSPYEVQMMRMIILTGCRKNEIARLCWKDYRGGHLHLADSKTGPKTVILSSAARDVLAGVKKTKSKYIFPSKGGNHHRTVDAFWSKLRKEIGLDDVRLHDFRHNYASIAIRQGESLNTIGKLLGHHQANSTLRYAHFDDAMMHQAVKKITTSMTKTEGSIK